MSRAQRSPEAAVSRPPVDQISPSAALQRLPDAQGIALRAAPNGLG